MKPTLLLDCIYYPKPPLLVSKPTLLTTTTSDFVVEQVFVPSKDGKVKIPMSIIKPAGSGFVQDGSNVALM